MRRAIVALLLLGAPLALAEPPDDPVSARAFTIRHRPVADAAELVEAVLSPEGALTLRKRLSILVVEDRLSVLERVAALLESFDLPPRSVDLTLTLFLGTDRRGDAPQGAVAGGLLSQDVRGVIDTLGDFTKWTAYEPLGSRAVTGLEGAEIVADLSDDYRVVFTVDFVTPGEGTVTIRPFSLQRLARDPSGAERFENLVATGMVVPLGKLHVVGAASGPDSKRALFLMVQAEAR